MKAVVVWCWIVAVGASYGDAQVLLSRRDYTDHGRTFSQIWMADAGSVDFRQLTHSAREHSAPVCSRDGKLIYFVSDRDAERSRNAYGGPPEREIWAYDRPSGQERLVWRTARDFGLDLRGTTADKALLLLDGNELRRLGSRGWMINNVDDAVVSPDGRRVALVIAESYDEGGQSQNAKLFVADTATGQQRTEFGKYEVPTWSPDGARIAVFSGGGLAILDVVGAREMVRVPLPKHDAPAQNIVWSPDGESLLVGLYGENGGAGDPRNDYFLLDSATRMWTPTLTARRLLWLRDKTILYLRPYGLTPLSPGSAHRVWTSQVAVYDVASRKDMALTSGLVLNDFLATCRR
ncbi:MAG TPA: hypothetical protein VN519_03555 [Bryobacteraceae bacterium]|nr:hypothetical protein [Bryobacteraceae bacterium]